MSLEKRRLSWQQPIMSKRQARYVYSEKELVSTLSDLRANVVVPSADNGLVIQCVGSLQLTKTLIVDYPVSIIGRATIYGSVSPLVQIKSDNVRLRDLIITQNSTTATCVDFYHATGLESVVLDDIVLNAASATSGALITTTLGTHTGLFTKLSRDSFGTALYLISGAVSSSLINLCTMNGGTNGFLISGGQKNVISMNAMGGALITTSASSGNNSISMNSNVGTITRHISDQVSGNT